MEIEEKLESIESKIETYNSQIENLSSLITTLIHSFQQNQLPSIKTEILNKIEEKFQDTNAFPDTDEMKEIITQLRADFTENQSCLTTQVSKMDKAVTKLTTAVKNISVNVEPADNSEIKSQLDNIESILTSLSEEISSFGNNTTAPTVIPDNGEKIDTISSLITAQNIANTEFLNKIENYFENLGNSISNLNLQAPSSSASAPFPVVASADMGEIKDRFDELNLSITSVLSAIKIVDKKYTELKSFQDVIDKLSTDVVSPILLASNDIKAFVNKSSKNFERLNQFVEEYDKGAFDELNDKISNVNIDVNKILTLVEEFKTNSDLSNRAISDNMVKLENILATYSENLTELTQNTTAEAVKDGVKTLNDSFYMDLLNLFNSLSFDAEAEDIKDFLENILSSVTIKTDENSEKLNSIMLQFKNLINKVEGIERTQNSISDYLKPEMADEITYSFDDIQSDLAKMRLVLNDISRSINSSEVVDELSAKIRMTSEQIENVSKALGGTSENDETVADIKEKIENLNSQVYDISVRTNKLLLSNEDSTLELKNNLELFKDVFEKANPEKLYELFYELTNYFNDVNEKIANVTLTAQASHSECVTIKNALVYVGEWLDNATNVLAEIRDNTNTIIANGTDAPTPVAQSGANSGQDLQFALSKIQAFEIETKQRLDAIENAIKEKEENIQKNFLILDTNIQKRNAATQAKLAEIEFKMDTIINALSNLQPAPVAEVKEEAVVEEIKPEEAVTEEITPEVIEVDDDFELIEETDEGIEIAEVADDVETSDIEEDLNKE